MEGGRIMSSKGIFAPKTPVPFLFVYPRGKTQYKGAESLNGVFPFCLKKMFHKHIIKDILK